MESKLNSLSKWKFIKGNDAYFLHTFTSVIFRRGIIGLSDKNEMCTLSDQSSIYNETVYICPTLSFLP